VTGYNTEIVTIRVGEDDYRLRKLTDRQQFSDPDGAAERAGISSATWPLFGMLWPAGLALAERMASLPIAGKRILEVGCGLGLSSLVLQRRGADITASDNHPLAGEFLEHNAQLNGLPPVRYRNAPWEGDDCELGGFDLIIGGDVLYERDHADLLAGFLLRHAKAVSQIMIADPGRGYRNRLARLLEAQSYTRTEQPFFADEVELVSKGHVMTFTRSAATSPIASRM